VRATLKLAPFAVVAAVALAVAGSVSGAGQKAGATKTLVFGGSADPVVLDGALVSDGESLRPIDQMFEGLTALKPGTTRVVPGLAKSWKNTGGGKTWIFKLRRGVRFHDGTKLTAKAVCYNYNRWWNFKGALQSADASYYWQTIFLGFHHNEDPNLSPSLYRGCKAKGKYKVRIKLRQRFGPMLPAVSIGNFGIASPKALKKYGANKAEIRGGVVVFTGSYGRKHPTGTGPFKFKSWRIGEKLVLVRNNRYWGKKAKLKRLIIRPITDATARLQALQTGEVMGYDLVSPEHFRAVRRSPKLKLLRRPAFNVAYVTIHQGRGSPMNSLKVRQAVAYGLNRKGVINAFYPPGSQVAKEFMPPQLFGWTKNVKTYSYNPTRARRLLNSSPCHVPCRIDFWYPTNISRPYMPEPKRNFQAFSASLSASGFRVVPHSAPWRPDYVKLVATGQAGDLNLIGWTGDYGDPDNFVGVFFGTYQDQFGFKNQKIFRLLKRARSTTNQSRRISLYKKANQVIMNYLPAVPYAHTSPALAFQKRVKGYRPSPVSIEPFSTVTIGGR
jgi:peptide/nickel transport system substrate-binding protein